MTSTGKNQGLLVWFGDTPLNDNDKSLDLAKLDCHCDTHLTERVRRWCRAENALQYLHRSSAEANRLFHERVHSSFALYQIMR